MASAPACVGLPPTGQLVVYVDTDAPVPPGLGRLAARSEPAPLFDSLRIEVFAPGESEPCAGCVREFPVDADRFGRQAVSIGVPAKVGVSGYRLRATLFLGDWILPCQNLTADARARSPVCAGGDPEARDIHPMTSLSRTVALPPVSADTIDEVSLFLPTESVGVPAGSPAAPLPVDPGKPSSSQVGTWEGAKRRGCTTPARPGEACVPAGAFWSGNARAVAKSPYTIVPHLVVMSPYFLKTTEVTVGECRAVPICDAYAAEIFNRPPVVYCVYTRYAGAREKNALNCITPTGGEAFCEAWGGTLPTDAQIEYAGRGLIGTQYPWGYDEATCADAVWGRNNDRVGFTNGPCYDGKLRPSEPGMGQRDRLVLETGTIVDLGGNLQETTRDQKGPSCECNQPTGVLRDPVCNDPARASFGLLGGAWGYGPEALALSPGPCVDPSFIGTVIGFRCARPGE
jgi:formylglycine-generating enzyme required for sulfatase activity